MISQRFVLLRINYFGEDTDWIRHHKKQFRSVYENEGHHIGDYIMRHSTHSTVKHRYFRMP